MKIEKVKIHNVRKENETERTRSLSKLKEKIVKCAIQKEKRQKFQIFAKFEKIGYVKTIRKNIVKIVQNSLLNLNFLNYS